MSISARVLGCPSQLSLGLAPYSSPKQISARSIGNELSHCCKNVEDVASVRAPHCRAGDARLLNIRSNRVDIAARWCTQTTCSPPSCFWLSTWRSNGHSPLHTCARQRHNIIRTLSASPSATIRKCYKSVDRRHIFPVAIEIHSAGSHCNPR